jgi:hypothetical protein
MPRRRILAYGVGLIGILGAPSAIAQPAAPPDAAPPPATEPAPPPASPPAAPVAAPAAADAPPAPAATPIDVAPAPTTFVPLKIESPLASIKLGFLAQPTFEALGNPNPALSGTSYNLYLRRIRLLVGGTLFGKVDYFFDTDSPNLFKANAEGVKAAPLGVQDAFVTFKAYEDYFKVDAGYMLPPLAHNAVQGAGTLYGLDYFANSFRHANVFNSEGDVGRDTGVQLRGLVADGHLEYRVGAFQGWRDPATPTDVAARNFFRVAGRLQLNVLDPETGFFYQGTYLGTKHILSFGASYDFQSSYHHWSLDGFLDTPLGPGALTAQVNVVKWNGGDLLAAGALPNQTAFMAEAGYRIDAVQLSPIVRFEYRNAVDQTAAVPDEARYGLGLGYWPYGHNVNLKAFYTRIQPKPDLRGYDQFDLQWQVYFF